MAEFPERSTAGTSFAPAAGDTAQASSMASLNMSQQNYSVGTMSYPNPYLGPSIPLSAQQEQLQTFWQGQMMEVHQVGTDPAEFKNHQLPLARIKKIMKSDEDVRMISAEAPVLFAKACEMFILELTLRSWNHSEENKRRTLQRNDISAAITRTDIFDFLVDIVPREEQGDDGPPPRIVPATNFPATTSQAGATWPMPNQVQPQPPVTSAGLGGDVQSLSRPMQAVDPAVMQFYMQQPIAALNLPAPGNPTVPAMFPGQQPRKDQLPDSKQ